MQLKRIVTVLICGRRLFGVAAVERAGVLGAGRYRADGRDAGAKFAGESRPGRALSTTMLAPQRSAVGDGGM